MLGSLQVDACFHQCLDSYMADIRKAMSEFVRQGEKLRERMRSSEREILTDVDLHILRAQLFLLESEAISVLGFIRKVNSTADPSDRAA